MNYHYKKVNFKLIEKS